MSLGFQKASKRLAKLKIAITGPAGSGKTMSSLLLAKGLGGRVAVIDTENNSACLYSDKFDGWTYDVLSLDPPYTVSKYLGSIELALKENYDILIIDSLSHVWAGEGGLLQQKEALDSRGGNSFTNWGQITKLHEQLKSKILHSDIHMIATMRSKHEYILEQNDKGKSTPKKVGLAPIQRDGVEYEFTTVFDVGMDHQFIVSKDRTGLFDGVVACMTEKTGEALNGWLSNADRTPIQSAQPQEHKPFTDRQSGPRPKELGAKIEETKSTIDRLRQQHCEGGVTAPTGNPDNEPGAYVIRFGKYTKGKRLNEVSVESIQKTRDWIEREAKRPLSATFVDFLKYSKLYIQGPQNQPEPEEPLFPSEEPQDESWKNEEVPF